MRTIADSATPEPAQSLTVLVRAMPSWMHGVTDRFASRPRPSGIALPVPPPSGDAVAEHSRRQCERPRTSARCCPAPS